LATIAEEAQAMKVFHRLGGKTTKEVTEATAFGVPREQLKKIGKFVMAIITDVNIVTEKWIYDATKLGLFPDIAQYLLPDATSEKE
jgi:hypothetical protein